MNKGLEAFYDLIKNQTITDEMIIIEKELKALEIIRNKNVNVRYLLECRFEDYNNLVEVEEELTKEEYDLLKEVLYDKSI